jgi:hypothetical protein
VARAFEDAYLPYRALKAQTAGLEAVKGADIRHLKRIRRKAHNLALQGWKEYQVHVRTHNADSKDPP